MYFSTQENFEALLFWLDSDRDRAGKKYEEIRHRLVRVFESRRCGDPEDLADETINRVLQKFRSINESYVGDPALYFYAVARNLIKESKRRAEREVDIDVRDVAVSPPRQDDVEEISAVLHEWLNTLTQPERNLLLDYYADEGITKIESHKKLAEAMNLSSAALRQRVHRLRMNGEKWIRKRLAEREVLKRVE